MPFIGNFIYTLAVFISKFMPRDYWRRAPLLYQRGSKFAYRVNCFCALVCEVKRPDPYLVEDYVMGVLRPKRHIA